MSTNIFLSPKTQFENIGDALINVVLCEVLTTYGHVKLNLSRCPDEFKENFNQVLDSKNASEVKNFAIYFLMILRCLAKGEKTYLFLSPGGYFGEVSRFQYIKAFVYNALLKLFSVLGLKVCLVGVSYERIGRLHKNILVYRSNLLHAHHMRDSLSIKYATQLGLNVDRQSTDLAFGLRQDLISSSSRKYDLAILVRVDQYDEQLLEIINIINGVLDECQSNKKQNILIASQVRRDDSALNKLEKLIRQIMPSANIDVRTINSIEEAQTTYATCKLVITNRLHVMLLASSVRSQTLALAHSKYNKKLIGIISDLNISKQPIITDLPLKELLIKKAIAKFEHIEFDEQNLTVHFDSIFRVPG